MGYRIDNNCINNLIGVNQLCVSNSGRGRNRRPKLVRISGDRRGRMEVFISRQKGDCEKDHHWVSGKRRSPNEGGGRHGHECSSTHADVFTRQIAVAKGFEGTKGVVNTYTRRPSNVAQAYIVRAINWKKPV